MSLLLHDDPNSTPEIHHSLLEFEPSNEDQQEQQLSHNQQHLSHQNTSNSSPPPSKSKDSVSNSNSYTKHHQSSKNDELHKAYQTFNMPFDLGQRTSLAHFEEEFRNKLGQVRQNKEKTENLIKSLETIRKKKTQTSRIKRAFFNLSPEQQQWVVLISLLLLCTATICISVGTAIKVQCDDGCSRCESCVDEWVLSNDSRATELCNASASGDDDGTVQVCFESCRTTHWIVALSGVWFLDVALIIVAAGTLTICFVECCCPCVSPSSSDGDDHGADCSLIDNDTQQVDEEQRNVVERNPTTPGRCQTLCCLSCVECCSSTKETFQYPARITLLAFCFSLLTGSVLAMLKLWVKSGRPGPEILRDTIPWQGVFSFGYLAYVIAWGFYFLLLIEVFNEQAKVAGLRACVRYFGIVVNTVSSILPLGFFIILGVNIDRERVQDKFDGYVIVAPLLGFFFLRCVTALIIPVSNFIKDYQNCKGLFGKILMLLSFYISGIVGLILAALTVNQQRAECDEEGKLSWLFAIIPILVFVAVIFGWTIWVMVLLCIDERKGTEKYEWMTSTLLDLMVRADDDLEIKRKYNKEINDNNNKNSSTNDESLVPSVSHNNRNDATGEILLNVPTVITSSSSSTSTAVPQQHQRRLRQNSSRRRIENEHDDDDEERRKEMVPRASSSHQDEGEEEAKKKLGTSTEQSSQEEQQQQRQSHSELLQAMNSHIR